MAGPLISTIYVVMVLRATVMVKIAILYSMKLESGQRGGQTKRVKYNLSSSNYSFAIDIKREGNLSESDVKKRIQRDMPLKTFQARHSQEEATYIVISKKNYRRRCL